MGKNRDFVEIGTRNSDRLLVFQRQPGSSGRHCQHFLFLSLIIRFLGEEF